MSLRHRNGGAMRKFKRAMALTLVTAMAAASFVGCSKNSSSGSAAANNATKEVVTDASGKEVPLRDQIAAKKYDSEGKVLNIYVWNDEFINRVADHFPGYEKVDATNGKIGDVSVKFTKVDNQDNKYQTNLDQTLQDNGDNQENADADKKIDIFLVEADYALKYVNSKYTTKLADLGITDADLPNQYQYTKDAVTDSEGNLKGISWQGCPGLLIYRRDIAKEVLGTDDPAEVQKSVADWDKFADTAKMMAAKNYKMTSSVNDTYRVFSNNVTSKWVDENNVINVDDNIKKWVDMSKAMVDAKQTDTHALWSDDWAKGFYETGNVFCYFGPAWLIDFSMHCDEKGSVGYDGGWAVTEGPQGFFWGGTWICAAAGTDNQELVKDLMLCLTTDEETMTQIVEKDHDFVNNSKVMEAKATDSSFGDKYLSNQNPVGLFCNGIKTVSLANISGYDQGCNEEFQNAMKDYFDGNYKTYEDALDAFYTKVIVKYPELKKPE